MTGWIEGTACALVMLLVASPAAAQDEVTAQTTVAEMPAADAEAVIADAVRAAPEHIGANAAVMGWDGAMLREGTNGWVCMPTPPSMAGPAPMCLDEPWMSWAQGWSQKTEPDVRRVGIGYMLAGDTGASNSDPYASGPDAVDDWVDAGAHVMIVVPDAASLEGVPTDPSAGAWVMWKGTPYAHIMVPIEGIDTP